MGRLLILILVALVAIWLIRRAIQRSRERKDAAAAPPSPAALVSCARCGVNLPAPEARMLEGRPYCSEEHARLGPGDGK
jgi:uncharacterized protein